MIIKTFTFNISELNKHISSNEKNEEKRKNLDIMDMLKFINSLKQIFIPDLNTIYFISTQEDNYQSYFINSIKNLFNKNLYICHSAVYQSYLPNYNVHNLVIISTSLYNNYNFKFEPDKILNHNIYSTKGTCIVQLTSTLEKRKNVTLFFIASHLPMNKKEIDLGYQERVDAMLQVNDYLKAKLDPVMSFNILWTGDLNFRIDENGQDQLNYLLDNGFGAERDILFEDLSQIYNYAPTCKTIMYDEKEYCSDTCKTPDCISCYDIHGKKGHRIPSYCDRVIGYNNFQKYNDFNTITFSAKDHEFIKYSDHNPIMTTVHILKEYDNNLYGGGKSNIDYLYKYNKYQSLLNAGEEFPI